MKVADHVWYITGGASGLGEATARQIHKLGGYVAIFDINEEAAEQLAKDLGGERSTFARVDVVSEEDVQEAIAKCDKQWPKVKVGGVVNCGGVGMAGKTINGDGEPFDLDTFRTVVEINLIGTFNVCRLVAARLVRDVQKPIKKADEQASDLGVLINTASVAAFEGQTGQVSYSAGKGGVVGMTLPMARDLAWFGIRTMTLAPALFSTPMADKMSEKAKKALGRQLEFPARFGLPEEFALAVVSVIENPMLVSMLLCAGVNKVISKLTMNGSTIRLDGASRMGKL
ncbi:NAD(P)-binding protein [Meira miltonrushii]|uniref:NAD(P)-binding protein n=1 Tax=Meira miltonrushii TaxID=1280837 RepID=A0A316V6V0_9BASI|nr:NAD(P)-binding protein [Meira miltonrushii]PWN32221.1 NAD(P)-binding protein [Meira miltonrushii]